MLCGLLKHRKKLSFLLSMASSSSNPFLSASLSLVFFSFLSFENKSHASAVWEEATELQHTHHRVPLTSLIPSSTCTSPPPGANRNGSLQVVHKYGPCSKLKQHTSSSSSSSVKAPLLIPHSEILKEDEARVRSIHSKLSKTQTTHEKQEEAKAEESLKRLDQAQIPAKSGSLLGSGSYFVTVGLGSPKRFEVSLLFDTGGDLTWTQCEPCAVSCYAQVEPIFDPSSSSSYSNIPCSSSSQCSQLSSALGCSKSARACLYGVQYGDSSFTIGFFAKERLTITPTDVVDNFLFGCGQYNKGLFRGIAGLFGLGRNSISFVEQTAQKYSKIFSYCIPSTYSNVGFLVFGSQCPCRNIKYIPFSTKFQDTSFYGLDFTGIVLGGIKLQISASVFSSGTVIDSGTVITRLPPTAYSSLRNAFRKAMSRYPRVETSSSLLDTCYDLRVYDTVYIPKVTLLFEGGVNLDLDATGVLYVVSIRRVCLGFAANEDASEVTILGNTQQKTLEILYDVGGGRIGFGPRGCK